MNPDHVARIAVTEALNACTRWQYRAELLATALAAYRIACRAVAELAEGNETRAALLPFLDRISRTIGLEQLEQLDLWQGAA